MGWGVASLVNTVILVQIIPDVAMVATLLISDLLKGQRGSLGVGLHLYVWVWVLCLHMCLCMPSIQGS